MKKYKLKPDARKFFDEKYNTVIETIEWWNRKQFPIQLLDEVPAVFVRLGRQTSECSRNITQYSKDGAVFEFTVHAPDLTIQDYEKMKTHELMDEIQKVLDKYFKDRYE